MTPRGSNRDSQAEVGVDAMRLDIFLKESRIIPRRSVAREVCDQGAILVNGQVAKPGRLIRVGDVIQWRHPTRMTEVRVARIPTVSPARKEASSLYESAEVRSEE